MTTRRAYIYGMSRGGGRHSLARGVGLGEWLRDNNIPAMWSPRLKGFALRTDRVGDVIARLELDGFVVTMKGALR